ncbi:DUF4215 domain-containing protein [Candidatus Peregrinibacteria bacterium]|nr:MAG: DUF4215 domain-containing protein [Candidatus Peregrinibacteria bacterium]
MREKILQQSARSLRNEFKAAERWQNATLADSPFDLVIDLNLIEIALFGRLATWTDEVYSFNTNGGANGGANGGPNGGPNGGAGGGSAEGVPSVEPIPDLECVPTGRIDDPNDPTQRPGDRPTLCGNGTLDGTELCDDGNTMSGDGCSSQCELEAGPTLTCRDPLSITFQSFQYGPVPAAPILTSSTALIPTRTSPPLPISCPPGTTAVDRADSPATPTEPPHLPTFVGGILRPLPCFGAHLSARI